MCKESVVVIVYRIPNGRPRKNGNHIGGIDSGQESQKDGISKSRFLANSPRQTTDGRTTAIATAAAAARMDQIKDLMKGHEGHHHLIGQVGNVVTNESVGVIGIVDKPHVAPASSQEVVGRHNGAKGEKPGRHSSFFDGSSCAVVREKVKYRQGQNEKEN